MTKELTETAIEGSVYRIHRLTAICLGMQKNMIKTDLHKREMKELQDAYMVYKRAITMDVIKIIKHVEPVTGIITHDNMNDFFPHLTKNSQNANQH